MPRETVKTDAAPAAIGPYSQAVKAGGFLFLSGQAPLDPKTGQVLAQVVKCTVFLKDLNDFGPMNEEYGSYFKELPPARTTVQVAKLPRDALIVIDAIATL